MRRFASAAGVFLIASLLVGCAKPAPVPEPAPTESPPQVAPAIPDAPPPAETLPAQPAPDAPSPTEPSAVPKPTAANEPSLESMSVATPSAKISVAVDVRYSFDSAALPGQPVTLNLAAIPRVSGSNLSMSVKEVAGVQLAAGPLKLQKSDGPTGVSPAVLGDARHRFPHTIARAGDHGLWLRVGLRFLFRSADGGTNAQKQDSVKQR